MFHQALMISLACLPHFNDLLSEHFARHCSFVVRSKSAARSSQHIPRGIECRRKDLGFFGIEGCGLEKSQYRHRRARQRLRRIVDLQKIIIRATRFPGDDFVQLLSAGKT